MTPADAAVAYDLDDEEPLDLSGYEAQSSADPAQSSADPAHVPDTLTALYRLRAAALQMIDAAERKEAEAARGRLILDKKLYARTHFDWSKRD